MTAHANLDQDQWDGMERRHDESNRKQERRWRVSLIFMCIFTFSIATGFALQVRESRRREASVCTAVGDLRSDIREIVRFETRPAHPSTDPDLQARIEIVNQERAKFRVRALRILNDRCLGEKG